MYNNKGMTLIESLFSFSLFISVVILLVSFMTMILSQEKQLDKHYQSLNKKEVSLSYTNDYANLIQKALR